MSEELRELKRRLLEVYDTFADRRIKNLDVGGRFIVDGRTDSDIAADGNVYGWFCSMFLDVDAADHVTLTMINVPLSADVEKWFAENAKPRGRDAVEIKVPKGEQDKLLALASLLYRITAPGRRYEIRHYKYAVPRTVESLKRLRGALLKGWS
jgi:hypothetical protein